MGKRSNSTSLHPTPFQSPEQQTSNEVILIQIPLTEHENTHSTARSSSDISVIRLSLGISSFNFKLFFFFFFQKSPHDETTTIDDDGRVAIFLPLYILQRAIIDIRNSLSPPRPLPLSQKEKGKTLSVKEDCTCGKPSPHSTSPQIPIIIT